MNSRQENGCIPVLRMGQGVMENVIIPAAVFAFVFVALAVGGLRALRLLEAHKAKIEAERLARVKARAEARGHYTGPRYNAHGREIN